MTLTGITNGSYPVIQTIYSTGPTQLMIILYYNGTPFTNNTNPDLGVGLWNITASTAGNQNYTYNSTIVWNSISKATPKCTVYLNGSTTDQLYEKGEIVNITGHVNTTYGVTIYLDMNATGYGNNFQSGQSYVENMTNTNLLNTFTYNATTHFDGDQNYTSCHDEIYLTLFQVQNITINTMSPINRSGDNDGNLIFLYQVVNKTPVKNCSLIINDIINQTNSTIINGTNMQFTLNDLDADLYEWRIRCMEETGITESQLEQFAVIKTTRFSGNTTDFSNVDVSNITNLVIEIPYLGKINFSENVNLLGGMDIDSHSNITFNRIYMNSSVLPALNKPARLTFHNITFNNPRPVRDGQFCPSSICTEVSYSNNVFIYDVNEFSVYSSEETPVSTVPVSSGGGRVECIEDSDCEENQYCSNYKCYEYECIEDSDCEKYEMCWQYICTDLFDVKILETPSEVEPGGFLNFTYYMKGMGNISGDITVDFIFKKDEELVSSGSDIVYLGSLKEKTEKAGILIPPNSKEGIYDLYVQISYGNYTAQAHRKISVKESIIPALDIEIVELPSIKYGEVLKFSVLFSFSKNHSSTVFLEEKIEKNNEIVWDKGTNLQVTNSKKIEESVFNLEPGIYELKLKASFGNKTSEISKNFAVIKEKEWPEFGSHLLILLVLSLILIFFEIIRQPLPSRIY
jgi:hypothetical protein